MEHRLLVEACLEDGGACVEEKLDTPVRDGPTSLHAAFILLVFILFIQTLSFCPPAIFLHSTSLLLYNITLM
jgi:hypothetical protein